MNYIMNYKDIYQAVSILILLDSILLSDEQVTFTTPKAGFNPYSIGFYSLIFGAMAGNVELNKVSILILLDSILL